MGKNKNNVFVLLFGLIMVTMPFSSQVNAWAIIVFGLWILWVRRKQSMPASRAQRNFWRIAAIFWIVMAIGLFNTSNISQSLRLFEARYAMIVFPLLAFLSGNLWNKKCLETILIIFSVVCILCALLSQGGLIIELLQENKPISDFFYWRNSSMSLSHRIGMHPTYLSMYCLFSIVIIYKFWIIHYRSSLFRIITGCAAILYLTIFLFHLASKISMLALAIVLMIIVIDGLKKFRFRILFVLVPLAIISGILLNLEIFALKSRFESSYINDILNDLNSRGSNIDPDDHRRIAWKHSIEIIRDNALVGVGTGDVMDELSLRYQSEESSEFLIAKEIDSHNQYLEAFLRNGLFGIIALFLLYYWGFAHVGLRHLVYICFILTITIVSLTENIMDRQKGAVFFGAIHTILFMYYLPDNRAKKR